MNFADPNLQYFALSVYEDWIATRWKLVPDSRKAELLTFLMDMALQSGKVRFLRIAASDALSHSQTLLQCRSD